MSWGLVMMLPAVKFPEVVPTPFPEPALTLTITPTRIRMVIVLIGSAGPRNLDLAYLRERHSRKVNDGYRSNELAIFITGTRQRRDNWHDDGIVARIRIIQAVLKFSSESSVSRALPPNLKLIADGHGIGWIFAFEHVVDVGHAVGFYIQHQVYRRLGTHPKCEQSDFFPDLEKLTVVRFGWAVFARIRFGDFRIHRTESGRAKGTGYDVRRQRRREHGYGRSADVARQETEKLREHKIQFVMNRDTHGVGREGVGREDVTRPTFVEACLTDLDSG